MKSGKLILISIVLMVLAAFSASAASIGFSSTSDLIIGGANQDREPVTSSLVVNYDNTNGSTTCNVQISTIAVGNDATSMSATDYVLYQAASVPQATIITVPLQNGANSITVRTNIPDDLDAVDRTTLKETAFHTYDVKVTPDAACTASGVASITKKTTVQAINQLLVDNVEVCTAEGCDDAKDGDDVEDLKPGDTLSVTVTTKNDFSNSDDNGENIKDINFEDVQLAIETDDDDVDFDDDDDFDLDADDEQTSNFKFDIDLDAKDGSVKMIVRVYGEDEFGAFHGEKISIDLNINRNSHDLVFRSVTVRPTVLSCSPRTAIVSYNLRNMGTRDEDDVKVSLSSPELSILEEKEQGELNEDRSRSGSFNVVVPESAAAGVYNLLLSSFYDIDSLSSEETVQLTIQDCGNAIEEEEEDAGDTITPAPVVQPPVITPPVVQPRVTPVVRTEAQEQTSNPWYLIGIILAIVVVLIIIIVLIMTLARGRGGENLE